MLPNEYLAFKDFELNRRPAMLAEARTHQLLREAGLAPRSRLAPLARWALARLGSLLVLTGGWLERRATLVAPVPR